MQFFNQYAIPFRGLAKGVHVYNFAVDDNFFSHFEESEVKQGKVRIDVEMVVRANGLELAFKLLGNVKVTCDICLEEFDYSVDYQAELFVDFGEESTDITDVDDRMIIAHHENDLQLAQHIYEYIHLSLPYRKVHPVNDEGKSTCNRDMLKKIKEYKIKPKKEDTDPRWDKLKSLYN